MFRQPRGNLDQYGNKDKKKGKMGTTLVMFGVIVALIRFAAIWKQRH